MDFDVKVSKATFDLTCCFVYALFMYNFMDIGLSYFYFKVQKSCTIFSLKFFPMGKHDTSMALSCYNGSRTFLQEPSANFLVTFLREKYVPNNCPQLLYQNSW
jgi:hypothetical protein